MQKFLNFAEMVKNDKIVPIIYINYVNLSTLIKIMLKTKNCLVLSSKNSEVRACLVVRKVMERKVVRESNFQESDS